jgi:hypothetical protein
MHTHRSSRTACEQLPVPAPREHRSNVRSRVATSNETLKHLQSGGAVFTDPHSPSSSDAVHNSERCK